MTQHFYVISLELITAHGYLESIYECQGRAALEKYLERWADKLDDLYVCEYIVENARVVRLGPMVQATDWLNFRLI